MNKIDQIRPLLRSNKPLSVYVNNRRTSLRLFGIEREALCRICESEDLTFDEYCSNVANDPARPEHSLTAKVRGAMLSFLIDQWPSSDI